MFFTISRQAKSPMQRLASDEQKLAPMTEKLGRRMRQIIDEKTREQSDVSCTIMRRTASLIEAKETAFVHTASVIELLNPLAVLMRGYSITYKDGKALMKAQDAKKGDKIRIKLSEGSLNAVVESAEKDN